MSLPDSVWLVIMGVALAGLSWNALNAWEAWRYLRRRKFRLVKPRKAFGLRLVMSNNQPNKARNLCHQQIPKCSTLKSTTPP